MASQFPAPPRLGSPAGLLAQARLAEAAWGQGLEEGLWEAQGGHGCPCLFLLSHTPESWVEKPFRPKLRLRHVSLMPRGIWGRSRRGRSRVQGLLVRAAWGSGSSGAATSSQVSSHQCCPRRR